MKQKFLKLITNFELIDSLLGVVGACTIIGAALFMQLFYHEKPCPLCLLQRVAFINVGIGLLLNLRYRNRASHWAIVIISACTGIAVSIRQILLHITSPEGFGSAVLGLHMYSWCFIGFAITIIGSALMLLIYPEQNN